MSKTSEAAAARRLKHRGTVAPSALASMYKVHIELSTEDADRLWKMMLIFQDEHQLFDDWLCAFAKDMVMVLHHSHALRHPEVVLPDLAKAIGPMAPSWVAVSKP